MFTIIPIKTGTNDVLSILRIFQVDQLNEEAVVQFYTALDSLIINGDALSHIASLQAKFYLFAKHPFHSRMKKRKSLYKRDQRKYDPRTLFDTKNISFHSNRFLENSKTPIARQNKIISSMEKGQIEESFIKTLNNALYLDFNKYKAISDSNYLIFRERVINDFMNWDLNDQWTNAEEKGLDFEDKFLKYYKNENEINLFRTFLYQCEALYNQVWENLFEEKLIELDLEHHLSNNERVLYKFMYTRQSVFDNHILMLEEILISFWNTLPTEQQALIFLVFQYEFAENIAKNLQIAIFRKLSAFLKYYPIWLEIIQLDEKLKPNERILLKSANKVVFYSVKQKNGKSIKIEYQSIEDVTFGEIKGDEELPYKMEGGYVGSRIEKVLNSAMDFENSIGNLTTKQKEVIQLLAEGYTEQEIASKLNISQPAVNQRKKSAILALKETLPDYNPTL